MRLFEDFKDCGRSVTHCLLRASRYELGQSLIEIAVVLPFLMFVLVGAVEMARLAYASVEVTNAASAGVKYGGQNPNTATDNTGIQTAAQDDAADISLDPVQVGTSCICSDGTACSRTGTCSTNPETILTVTTQTTFNPGFHMPGFPSTFVLKGQAVQKVLQ
jgi:Flp pilus assembly protein TadG